jgi:NAD-dependent deacetylase
MDSPKVEIPDHLRHQLKIAQKITVLTGAGFSAESGIPTFREAQTGLWAQYDPQELATPQAFIQDPKLVWDWYTWRRSLIRHAEPNPGHYALAKLESIVPSFTLITQNVDGFHALVGNKNIIELHGNIFRTKCFQENVIVEIPPNVEESPPACPHCSGHLRPDVVWFGEQLPPNALESAIKAAGSADIFLLIGTSAVVQPAASLPIYALQSGAVFIEINPAATPLSVHAHHTLRGPSGRILPALVAAVWPD